MTAKLVTLRPPDHGVATSAEQALLKVSHYVDRCKLAANTAKAYRRQCASYVAWLTGRPNDHPDAFVDVVGAEAAVTAWRRHLRRRLGPATVNQALAAVTLMYEHGAGLRIQVKRARVPAPGEPDALTVAQQGAVERAAARRGTRDAAITALLLYTGARIEECARLDVEDLAITARTGQARLHGKGDEVRTVPIPSDGRGPITAWLLERGRSHTDPGPLWTGQRGRLSASGLTQVVLAVGADAGVPGLRPHRLRHTYATRLRQGGADPAQVQALLGHASLDTTARYFNSQKLQQTSEAAVGESWRRLREWLESD